MLRSDVVELPVEHWTDGDHSGRDNVKFWAGAAGYPGAALARYALAPVLHVAPGESVEFELGRGTIDQSAILEKLDSDSAVSGGKRAGALLANRGAGGHDEPIIRLSYNTTRHSGPRILLLVGS